MDPVSAHVPTAFIASGQISSTVNENGQTLSTWKNTLEQTGLASQRKSLEESWRNASSSNCAPHYRINPVPKARRPYASPNTHKFLI